MVINWIYTVKGKKCDIDTLDTCDIGIVHGILQYLNLQAFTTALVSPLELTG